MRRLIQAFLFVFVLVVLGIISQKLKVEFMPKAQSQTPPATGAAASGPSDMPIPPEMMGNTPPAQGAAGAAKPSTAAGTPPPTSAPAASAPPPPVPQKGLPVDIKGAATTPVTPPGAAAGEDLPPAALPAPQDLDPSLKFLDSHEFVYDGNGRRDPFKSYLYVPKKAVSPAVTSGVVRQTIPTLLQSMETINESVENYDLTELSVAAILWDVNDPKALLEAPSKKMFMVHKHTRIGKNSGYVAAIREGEVVVVEVAPDGKTPTTRVMVLQH